MPTARAVADALQPFDNTFDAQRLAEQASSSTTPLDLITLRKDDNDRISAMIGRRPGVVITPQPEMTATDDRFAPAILNEVKKQVASQLVGQPGWRVVSVNQNGADLDVLNEVPGKPAPSITISLDRAVQNAAQDAVNMVGRKAMIVAIKPSTGEILAVAQNVAADADGPTATMGLYPPGSTFKMVTAGAAIESDLATPNTLLGCPGTIDIGHRTIPNYDKFDLGVVPMAKAFANSCNTTFAELASRMAPRALTIAAAQYGIGADYQVAGLDTVTGEVPPTVNLAERTEDGFGQGKVLVSPFGMALAAATVAAGKTPVPQLIEGRPTRCHRRVAPAITRQDDRRLLRLDDAGLGGHQRYGQGPRGRAATFGARPVKPSFPAGSHAWFAGYRGDRPSRR